MTAPSRIIDPNNDAPAKYKKKLTFEQKTTFYDVPLLGKSPKVSSRTFLNYNERLYKDLKITCSRY